VVIWYIFSFFGMLHRQKSGSPEFQKWFIAKLFSASHNGINLIGSGNEQWSQSSWTTIAVTGGSSRRCPRFVTDRSAPAQKRSRVTFFCLQNQGCQMVCFRNKKSQFGQFFEGLEIEKIGIFYGQLEYISAIWCILSPFGNLVTLRYIFPHFGLLHM
jgi:hypothetical protein